MRPVCITLKEYCEYKLSENLIFCGMILNTTENINLTKKNDGFQETATRLCDDLNPSLLN